jgi:hypothetical protein
VKTNPDFTTIIAEDGWINVQMLKYNLKELNLLNVCKFEINGKAAVESVQKKVLEIINEDNVSKTI